MKTSTIKKLLVLCTIIVFIIIPYNEEYQLLAPAAYKAHMSTLSIHFMLFADIVIPSLITSIYPVLIGLYSAKGVQTSEFKETIKRKKHWIIYGILCSALLTSYNEDGQSKHDLFRSIANTCMFIEDSTINYVFLFLPCAVIVW